MLAALGGAERVWIGSDEGGAEAAMVGARRMWQNTTP